MIPLRRNGMLYSSVHHVGVFNVGDVAKGRPGGGGVIKGSIACGRHRSEGFVTKF